MFERLFTEIFQKSSAEFVSTEYVLRVVEVEKSNREMKIMVQYETANVPEINFRKIKKIEIIADGFWVKIYLNRL